MFNATTFFFFFLGVAVRSSVSVDLESPESNAPTETPGASGGEHVIL